MKKNYFYKVIIIIILIIIVLLLIKDDVSEALTMKNFNKYKTIIVEYADSRPLFSALIYICINTLFVALGVPVFIFSAMISGFLFGMFKGLIFADISVVMGSTITYICSRYLLKDYLQTKKLKYIEKLTEEMAENGKFYLLTVRLIPIFPFISISIFSAITMVPLPIFIVTTAIGIIPETFICVYTGINMASVNSMESIFTTKVIIAFLLMGIMSIVPVIVKKLKNKREL
ncbi:TVP38/TMEM64 family protein [Clostridiisalibacter paucivorans]|uniref:TVP38/TMEM64 family protein n=1 Tax=Clostridiisalibacter paucivorans TaxID=408753 RepID=UPI00047EBB7C|nr:VTT domain-containing protein [Clostridiisalibacter paucivorans]